MHLRFIAHYKNSHYLIVHYVKLTLVQHLKYGVMYNVEFNSFGLIHINLKITIKVKTYKLMHIPSIIFGTLIFDHVYNIFEL